MAGKGYSACCEVIKCKTPECNNLITLHGWGHEKEYCTSCIKERMKLWNSRAYRKIKEKENGL